MSLFSEMSVQNLEALKASLQKEYDGFVAKELSLNMARGKPGADQLDLSLPMFDVLTPTSSFFAEDGTDCRNYGVMDGIPEAKRLMGEIMEQDPKEVCVFGNSSLNIMFDLISQGYTFGYLGCTPWKDLPSVKWICLVPGYDRHFAIVEHFGMELIPVALGENGPDMDVIENLVANDDAIKGIWCVPQYSNPSGITYSDETVKRLATMKCAAEDFRIFWDNAYCVHHLYEECDHVLDIAKECNAAGHPDRYFKFASTSKVTLPGAGIAAVAASEANLAELKKRIGLQTVGYDKINQLRHVRFLKDAQGVAEHMKKHAAIIAPKFALVDKALTEGLEGTGCATWTHPNGGYFISFDGMPGTAKRIVSLAKNAGVVMTGAGATWPHKNDPQDTNIRIAPTLPPLSELEQAMEIFVCCVKLASVEKLLA